MVQLADFTPALINQAVDIYLKHAYDQPSDREAHVVSFAGSLCADELLSRFLNETDTDRDDAHRAYALCLGSQDYPHMKLALWEAYYRDEYVLAVDTHDGFQFDESAPDYQEWLQLKDKNRQRRNYIEYAWYEAGLPTQRKLKEERFSHTDIMRQFKGHEILLVDDDADAAAIVRLILQNNGFQCHWTATVREALAYAANPDNTCGMALIDIVMCDGSGVDVVRGLRADPRTQDIPLVLTSAMRGSEVQVVAVSNYLRKPFNVRELLELVDRVLREEYDGHHQFLDK